MSHNIHIDERAIVDPPVSIGSGTKVWCFSHVMSGAIIGCDCVIGQNVMVASTARLGNNVHVQNNVSIYDNVVLEDDVFCGPSAVFTNVLNPRSAYPRKNEFRDTVVKRGATIGANATIVCGTTLGAHCFVAAGAVVTKDVPAFALVAGVPAQRIGWMSRFGERLEFDSKNEALCEKTGDVYRLTLVNQVELEKAPSICVGDQAR